MNPTCPLCEGFMQHYDDGHFWICTRCYAELFPFVEDDLQNGEKLFAAELRYKKSLAQLRGGSRPAGRKRSKPIKPKRRIYLDDA